ncbi:hypothetical protein AB9R81_23375 [Vibrio cyclitrophicus]|jgi:hypothetical protein|uniref:hypothetical protein n=1 Tax=Vibrio splendidus TaxID=29497 RepID=UPI000C865545|nr:MULTISPECIES: hypothetical protein [Vibrio]CAK2125134.1 Histidine kinase/HSP90-like ATPase domain-containing protein [Vibrio crassostreae]MCQ8870196.1 hypothetical protein [Vibrio splendidus]PMI91709.1 hypothetical protein BCU33_10980 [Vibrio lentus]PTO58066.1 hypothetical protein CWN99_23985 [Vibrio splendidus]CAK2126458.1 Histidine kinase/HSP90-like ATPase domain-containing protein [Vibrio crassostreae]
MSSREDILWEKRTKKHQKRKSCRYNPFKVHSPKVLGYKYIPVPENLDIYNENNMDEMLDFLERLFQTAEYTSVILDFSDTRYVSAAALLLLYSKLDSYFSKPNRKLIRINVDSLKGDVKTAINVSGLRRLTLKQCAPSFEAVGKTLPIVKGTADGEEFEYVIDHIRDNVFQDLDAHQEQRLGSAVSETVGNVKLHAYPCRESCKPWWVICNVYEDTLFLAIYDDGVGIPSTILQQDWINNLLDKSPELFQRAASRTDADLIELSMKLGKSQTKQKKHGKGSKSIQALVEDTPDGVLWIYSNKGMYHKTKTDVNLINNKRSISGTLVQWNIKIR